MAVREEGKIISALQMISYPMTFCGETIATSYVSGACTHPDYRSHGAMRRLLRLTHRRMMMTAFCSALLYRQRNGCLAIMQSRDILRDSVM